MLLKITKLLAFSVLFFVSSSVWAQDDWQKLLADETVSTPSTKVIATFKTTRIINSQSIETVKKRTLDFRVGHRFGTIGGTTGNSHNLYGFDASSDIRLAFEYGINDRLTVGFSRSKVRENLQGLLKYRLLEQTDNNKVPVSVTVYTDAAFTPEKDIDSSYVKWEHRLNYSTELCIARKFSPGISLQIMPTWIHRNYVRDYLDDNEIFALGAGGRIKFTKRVALIFDYYYVFNEYHTLANSPFYNPLGLGIEIETGGHVFSVMFTNSAGLIESEFIPNTLDSWETGGIRFSFNISRNFKL